MNDYPMLAQRMLDLQEAHSSAKEAANTIYRELDNLKRVVIPQALEEDNIASIDVLLHDGQRRKLTVLDQISVKQKDPVGLAMFLRENDAEELIKPTVNSSSLGAWVKERLKSGDDLPNECIDISIYSVASIRKA